jgi:hypothetical protein
MPFTSRFLFASVLALLLGGSAFAGTEKSALYQVNIVGLFLKDNKPLREELKITPEQEKSLKASEEKRGNIFRRYEEERAKVQKSNLPASEKDSQYRALETQASNDLFKVYEETLRPEQIKRFKQILLQRRGMDIFDHPEIRDALRIGDKEAKELREARDKLILELRADVKAKKISQQDAARKTNAMVYSVPDKVRELLNRDQQKVLEELLGEKYDLSKR